MDASSKKTLGLYYCSHCKHIDKYVVTQQSTTAACHNCGQTVTVYELVHFAKLVMSKWATTARELHALKTQELEVITDTENNKDAEGQPTELNPLADVKLSQTDVLANAEQHQPLLKWFNQQQITPTFDYSSVDMSGYYDEAAEKIGNNYSIMKDILGKVGWSYRKNHTGLNIDLKKYSQKEAQIINNICRVFYSHTLFSRFNYQKKEKNIHLKLQQATPIKQFLNGIWLEWFALNELLNFAKNKGSNFQFSCARSVNIEFNNQDVYELDVVFYENNQHPLIIECKTGEFRRDIDKFLNLQKRLNIPAKYFVILSTDLSDSQAKSLTGMYGLTFVNLNTFSDFLSTVL